MPSDKQLHPRLRKLQGKLWTKQIILLKLSVATSGGEEQFISSFTTAALRKLALPAGGRTRRRAVSQSWWLGWSLLTNACAWAASRLAGRPTASWLCLCLLRLGLPRSRLLQKTAAWAGSGCPRCCSAGRRWDGKSSHAELRRIVQALPLLLPVQNKLAKVKLL